MAGRALATQPEELVATIHGAAERYGVPPLLLEAIAICEGGNRGRLEPWAVNVGGKSLFPASKAEALAIIHDAARRGQSYDIGVMQINDWWLWRFDLQPEQVIEPEVNALIGSWIMGDEIRRRGMTWEAVASYHHPLKRDRERGWKYALRVAAVLEKLVNNQ